jgi:hypothetical protein
MGPPSYMRRVTVMWKNVVQSDRPQTHTEYVTSIAFSHHQWSQEPAWMLRSSNTACLSYCTQRAWRKTLNLSDKPYVHWNVHIIDTQSAACFGSWVPKHAADYMRAVRKVSSHFEYLKNRSRGLDVTWQPVRRDLTAHPLTVTVPWG